MKNTNDNAIMKRVLYSSPEAFVLDIRSEGVLCYSPTGVSAEKIEWGTEINDYEQIF